MDLLDKHPIIPAILKFRRVAKLRSAYLDSFRNNIDDLSRVHCTLWIPGTETGRISTREGPPLQTVPRASDKEEGQFGKVIKDCIAAAPGTVLMSVDSKQSELRVAAEYSQEPFLVNGFQDPKWDLHTATTIELYGQNFKKEEREACKEVTFGFLYGGSEASLIITIVRRGHNQIPIEHAKSIVGRYAKMMGKLWEYRVSQFELLKTQGFVSTPTGRRRRFYFINQENQDEARKAAMNAPIQGLSSEITLISMIELHQGGAGHIYRWGARIVMTVHDSIILECPEGAAIVKKVAAIVESKIVEVATRYVKSLPWGVDTSVGTNLGSLIPLERWLQEHVHENT